ncbi:DUF1073 domain-containing protein [bacterium]|nr:DUF1073 domain-containing protein [bacterium]
MFELIEDKNGNKMSSKDSSFYGLTDTTSEIGEDHTKFTQDLSNEFHILLDENSSKSERYLIYDKLYRDALIKKAVDIPVDDSLSEWREIDDSMLEDLDKSLKIKNTLIRASKTARKYGEVLIIPVLVATKNNRKIKIPLSKKLEDVIDDFDNIQVLKLITINHFTPDEDLETDIENDNWGKPKWFRFSNGNREIKIHPSRVIHISNTEDSSSFIDSVLPYFDHYFIRANELTRTVTEANWIILKTDFKRVQQEMSMRLGLIHNNQNHLANKEIIRTKTEEGIKNRILHMRNNARSASAYAIDKEFEEIVQIKKDNIDQINTATESALSLIAGVADVPTERFLGKKSSGLGGGSSATHYTQFLSGFRSKLIGDPLDKLDSFLMVIYPKITTIEYEWNKTVIERMESDKDRTEEERANNKGGFDTEG